MLMKNKKAQFESRLLAIVLIFVVGAILFFMNHFNQQIYSEFDSYFNESTDYNGSEAHQAARTFEEIEESSIWDYAFLAFFIGFLIQIVLFSFATQFNIAFYWIMVIVDIPLLIVGVITSNIWQELVANPEFATTITRFPIANAILGTYFPTVVVVIFFFSSIILFGKRPGAG